MGGTSLLEAIINVKGSQMSQCNSTVQKVTWIRQHFHKKVSFKFLTGRVKSNNNKHFSLLNEELLIKFPSEVF